MVADNLALKLLVAGIIGAVVGAAAAERYHFPTGRVYGGFNRGPSVNYQTRPAIDPMIGSGRAERPGGGDGPRVVWGSPPPDYWPDWRPPPPPRPPPRPWVRMRPRPAAPRTALCWREFEDWNFGTTGHYVRCPPGGARYRPRSG
jgi:hypothetical protein